jgi:hypothetical protein
MSGLISIGNRTAALMLLILLPASFGSAEVNRWRVGDGAHPWGIAPVTGRLDWGRGWSVEILVDDDGDGLVDEDRVELIDNDGDGLINEDGPDAQIDNDGDGLLSEDPVNSLDDDGDGLVDEDPVEAFDNDLDGLVDEDPPDPQVDDDGDGRLNEDGTMSDGDDDYDGLTNEDPPDGMDNDGDGLVDEDGPRLLDDPALGVTTWLRPIKLDSTRNLVTLINERFLAGEFGQNTFMLVPSEFGFRNEPPDPFSATNFSTALDVVRDDYGKMVDGDINTAYGSSQSNLGGLAAYLMGFYYIDRVVFRPRPVLPTATLASYIIYYGTPETIDPRNEVLRDSRVLVPAISGQSQPVVKDIRFDPPVLMGRINIQSLDPFGTRVETAEVGLYGEGFPLDASFTSEIIDVGTPVPRIRRYSRPWESFSVSQRDQVEAAFPDIAGKLVNWGKVRWRGRRIGSEGNVRIQFRSGSTPDTHVYARRLGPGVDDTRGTDGQPLDSFSWVKLSEGRIDIRGLQYNELGVDLGADDEAGWSFWSAPVAFEDGLIDETLPPELWHTVGVPLPLPGRTRYLQFRILFDSTQQSAVMLDFLEFDYDVPLVSGGILAEVFPATVPLGEEIPFRYFLRPFFAENETTSFNRLEIDVPDANSRVDVFRFDGQDWAELPVLDEVSGDPLLGLSPQRLAPLTGSTDSLGQYAQTVVVDSVTGTARLLIKLPPMSSDHFRFGENIEVVLRARLFHGSTQFTSVVWDDRTGQRSTIIPHPVEGGDASPEVATDALLVVVDGIDRTLQSPRVSPNPFTPNGDGINDEVVITFDLFLLLEGVDVTVDIHDLSSRLVRRLSPAALGAGETQVHWDGFDEDGNLLPPGQYIYVLKVRSDKAKDEQVGTLSLVY